jgi:hypothetical protein
MSLFEPPQPVCRRATPAGRRASPDACNLIAGSAATALDRGPRATQLRAIAQRLRDSQPTKHLNHLAAQLARRGTATAHRQGDERAAQLQAVPSPNRTGLPDGLRSGIEALSGLSMDHVRVHYNSAQPAQLNALAYAQGSDIHLAPGQEQHLPHEAWHVVQQAQGRVRPTRQMKSGVPVNDDAALEREADVMGARALRVPTATAAMASRIPSPSAEGAQTALQRKVTLVTYKDEKKKKGKSTIALDAESFIQKLGYLFDFKLDAEAVKNFLDYGIDFELEPDDFKKESSKLESDDFSEDNSKLDSLVEAVKSYHKPLNKDANFDEEEKKDPLERIKKIYFKLQHDINIELQSENKGKDTSTGANDSHISLAQKIIGQSMMEAAEKCLSTEKLSREETEWLKSQKSAGKKKMDKKGETHHLI